ncbi:MAG: hypothetical protein ABIJ59_13855 [Pseudomonadota bacterium]
MSRFFCCHCQNNWQSLVDEPLACPQCKMYGKHYQVKQDESEGKLFVKTLGDFFTISDTGATLKFQSGDHYCLNKKTANKLLLSSLAIGINKEHLPNGCANILRSHKTGESFWEQRQFFQEEPEEENNFTKKSGIKPGIKPLLSKQMDFEAKDFDATACHESAHAIAGFLAGGKINEIYVDSNEGEIKMNHSGNFGSDPKAIAQSILTALAGPSAEIKFRHEQNMPVDGSEWLDDTKSLLTKLAIGNRYQKDGGMPWEINEFWDFHRKESDTFCTRQWPQILAFAKILKERRQIEGQKKIHKILTGIYTARHNRVWKIKK